MSTVGDDIAWIKPDANGPPAGDQPRGRLLRRRARHVAQDQPERDGDAGAQHDLHQRRAHARGRRLVGGDDRRAAGGMPRLAGATVDAGRSRRETGATAAHPNARFTAPAAQCPIIDPDWEAPDGRADQRDHLRRPPRHDDAARLPGVQLDAPASTSARRWARRRRPPRPGGVGKVRRDPMAMLPFCGYHMGDYFRHWIRMQRALSETPRIFHVNWFRKDADGRFLWPGFRENMRVLKWIVDRVRGRVLGARDADRLDAALRGHRLDRAATSRRRSSTRCRPSTRRSGGAK